MSAPAELAPALLRRAARAGGAVLVLFAFYAGAVELGTNRGLVGVVASPAGLALLALAGLLLVAGGAEAALAAGPVLARASRALTLAGAGLALAGLPASLVLRASGTVPVLEGETLGPRELPGLPPLEVGRITLLPRGPHLLSKTVAVSATAASGGPVEIGLFPPARVGPWLLSVFRFGYAPAIEWVGADGRTLGSGRILLGTVPHDDEEARLVTWTPEPNVMMGAGTFPPKLEELVRGTDPEDHLFLRLDEATLGGARRDLRDPDAYRWLADGRPERPLFFVQVLRGREKVFEGRVAGGSAVQLEDGGLVAVAPDVAIFADVLATRDPWLPVAGLGLASFACGLVLLGVSAAAARVRRAGPEHRSP